MLSCTSDQPGWLEQTGSLLLLCTSLGAVGLGVRLRADAEQCLWVEGCALLGLDCVPWRKLQPALCWGRFRTVVWLGGLGGRFALASDFWAASVLRGRSWRICRCCACWMTCGAGSKTCLAAFVYGHMPVIASCMLPNSHEGTCVFMHPYID